MHGHHIRSEQKRSEYCQAWHVAQLAEVIDWSAVLSYVDARREYMEVREVGIAPIGTRLYCVVFTQRGETMHVISLRKANDREVRNYAKYD
nr:BrnT family toxin [Caballeronia sp. ATUFL_F1_KS4A]